MTAPPTEAAPHAWSPQRWRRWLCRHCYAPRAFHPRTGWVLARRPHDHRYLSVRAPHFKTAGW